MNTKAQTKASLGFYNDEDYELLAEQSETPEQTLEQTTPGRNTSYRTGLRT